MAEPIDVARTCVCLHSRMAARALTRAYDAALKPVGLKGTQFTLLVAIHLSPEVSIQRLAGFLAMERTTLTRNLKVLERDGLIEIGPEGPRRARNMSLTPRGERLMAEALPLWEAAQERVRDRLGTEAWDSSREALTALIDSA